MFFHYHQNNSGGSFGPPAINVIVEAESKEQADSKAEEIGLYFDGCNNRIDCPCCGDRWYRAYDGDRTPQMYGESVFSFSKNFYDWSTPEIPFVRVYYSNGKIKTVKKAKLNKGKK